jgi:hypothetical protein
VLKPNELRRVHLELALLLKDQESAQALANRWDDRTRKEFEKWAVLTYTSNRGIINEKKGADAGIDGTVFFMTGPERNAKMVPQVKSGKSSAATSQSCIAICRGKRWGWLPTLQEPTKEMLKEAKGVGTYHHEMMGSEYDRIQIVTISEMLTGARLNLPLALEVLKAAERKGKKGAEQPELEME